MKHRIPIIALSLLLTSCLTAEPTTQPATQPAFDLDAAAKMLTKQVGGTWRKQPEYAGPNAPTVLRGWFGNVEKPSVWYQVSAIGSEDRAALENLYDIHEYAPNARILGVSGHCTVIERASDPNAAAKHSLAIFKAMSLKPPKITLAAHAAQRAKTRTDRFTFALLYKGERSKGYRGLTLRVPPTPDRGTKLAPALQITKQQAGKLIDALFKAGYYQRAGGYGKGAMRLAQRPTYAIVVQDGRLSTYVVLGWNAEMLRFLDTLRPALEGDAAKAMDKLLMQLEGHRKKWGKPATRPTTQPAVETPMSRVAQKRLRQKVPKITFNKNKLADVIQFFREFSNLDIVVNWKSLKSAKINKATPVSLNLLNPSMKDILEGILKSAAGNVAPGYVVDEEGVITISMPKHLRLGCKITLPERPTEKSRRTYKTLMHTMPKFDLPGVKFADVVQFFRDYLNARIAVDWKALKSVGIDKKTPISLHLIDVSAKKVLEKTLESAGGLTELSCVIDEEGVIQISTKKPDTTTSAPAVDPAVMVILKRLEAAGEKYPNITANIDYKVDMLQTGDTESRTGRVYYQGPSEKESAKFRIHFDTLRQGKGPKIKDVVDYAFDGAWLTVRKERIKQMSRYQVARPGEKVNPLQLGKGPFPVPFGQKADAVIKHFRATTRSTRNTGVSLVDRSTGVSPVKKHGRDGHATLKTDPKDTDYIKLTTRRRYRKEFSVVWLEMWISRKTSLPVKIVAEDRSENQTTVIFKDTKTPKSFDKKIFTFPRPPAGWEYHVEKFKGRVKP